tara:strand:+ start:610 stop:924 length:315 start_codon:yes stop_codon:yes gene_type:complete
MNYLFLLPVSIVATPEPNALARKYITHPTVNASINVILAFIAPDLTRPGSKIYAIFDHPNFIIKTPAIKLKNAIKTPRPIKPAVFNFLLFALISIIKHLSFFYN